MAKMIHFVSAESIDSYDSDTFEHFAERVTLFTNADGNARATVNGTTRDVETLHPWEQAYVCNHEPFAHPSRVVSYLHKQDI